MKKVRTAVSLIFAMIFITCNVMAKPISLNINARCAIAMDRDSHIVLYEKNAELLVPMASTTKIITSLVAINSGNLDRKIEISSHAASIRGSTVGYRKGEQVTLRELLYGLMLRSGNDAAIAIAEGVGGTVEEFVKKMNECADTIGLTNTHFESPHGLDSLNHYSTAYDLAIATAKASESKLFREIVSSKDVEGQQMGFTRSFHNINKILWQIPEATGVKTGYTGNAGKCLVTSAKAKGRDIIIVVLNCPERWAETKKIHEHVIKNYDFNKVAQKGAEIGKVFLEDNKKEISLISNEDIVIPMLKGSEYKTEIIKPERIYTSVAQGSEMGSIQIYKDGIKIYSKSLISNSDYKGNESEIKKWLELIKRNLNKKQ